MSAPPTICTSMAALHLPYNLIVLHLCESLNAVAAASRIPCPTHTRPSHTLQLPNTYNLALAYNCRSAASRALAISS